MANGTFNVNFICVVTIRFANLVVPLAKLILSGYFKEKSSDGPRMGEVNFSRNVWEFVPRATIESSFLKMLRIKESV